MPRLVLVRHAQPDGAWGHAPDPGLDDIGRTQAATVAAALTDLGPVPIVVSPLRRTRETAAPLAAQWGIEPVVEPGVGELAAPVDPVPDHATWLRTLMEGRGADAPEIIGPFRDRVLRAIRSIPTDSVVVTHFLAINAIVGAAEDDDRVVLFAPAHCSRTIVDVTGDGLEVMARGVRGDGTARL